MLSNYLDNPRNQVLLREGLDFFLHYHRTFKSVITIISDIDFILTLLNSFKQNILGINVIDKFIKNTTSWIGLTAHNFSVYSIETDL